MTVINLEEGASIVELSAYLTEQLGISIDPIPDILKYCPVQYAEYTKEGTNYTIGCNLRFILAEDEEGEPTKELTFTVIIEYKNDGINKTRTYNVQIKIPIQENLELICDGIFKDGQATDIVVLSGSPAKSFPLELLGDNLPIPEELIPSEIEIGANQNILFVLTTKPDSTGSVTNNKRKFIIGIGINGNLDLSQLPLVAAQLPPEQINNNVTIELLVALQTFDQKELKAINKLLIELATPLKITPPSSTGNQLYKGVSIAAYLSLGSYERSWFFRLKRRTGSGDISGSRSLREAGNFRFISSIASTPDDNSLTIVENGAWLTVQKSFGPLHIEKIGLQYKRGEIHLVPEITLEVSKFSLSLVGISISSPLKSDLECNFNLEGFGLEYNSDSLDIGGSFARIVKSDGTEEYLGLASLGMKVKGKALSISAIGSYAEHNGQLALFLYAVVNYPLGGPPFFFVTGFAAGFGYNRSLTVPPIEQLHSFPLVSQAINGTGQIDYNNPGATISDQLHSLANYIKPASDSGFLALGIKFTSFKLVNSFGLLTVAINEGDFEVNLLGTSSLIIPPRESGLPAVGRAELVMAARFAPSEGFLSVRAQLTPNSYIFSGDCRLTGGFAFCVWYGGEHDGDFVITFGGYHPRFNVPKHYPQVPRLGFNWQLGSTTSIRGENYFALCSHALMAGGRLAFEYESGCVWARFQVGADFLICWKPYYYDIWAGIHISGGIDFVSVSVGVDLHLWGPEFAGTAEIDLWLVSATIEFGNHGSRGPDPINWDDFRESFLPPSNEVCSVAVSEGLVKQLKDGNQEYWIVNPKEFSLVTDAFIPSKEYQINVNDPSNNIIAPPKSLNQDFSISPMGIKKEKLQTQHRIAITRDGASFENEFKFEPVTKKTPTAMWGEPRLTDKGKLRLPDANGERYVDNVLSGFRITPIQEPTPGITGEILIARLQYDIDTIESAYSWETLQVFEGILVDDDAGRTEKIRQTVASNSNRNPILEALGFAAEEVEIDSAIADAFIFAPQVK